jgi:two-component system sensor kinase FixL
VKGKAGMDTDFARSLFEAIADSAILLDKAGRIVDWNQGATALFGYPKKEVLGRSVNLIYQKNQPFPKIIQDILPRQKRWSAEIGFTRKNGTKGLCKTTVVPLGHNTHHHNKSIVLLTHQNISGYKNTELELKKTTEQFAQEIQEHLEIIYTTNALLIKNIHACEQMEKNLRESELRFHLLAENATDIISRHTPDGTYLYASPSCKTLLGFKPEELIGHNAYKFLHHEDVPKLRKILNRRKEYSQSQTITYRIRRKDGDYRWFESNIRIVRDDQSHAIREVQTASRDVTDHILDKKARLRGQQLAHVFRLSTMEEMASGMAHEISQPLAAIVNYTQGCVRYLQNDKHEPDQLIEIMKKAVAQAERAGEVIHRLKNFFCKGQIFRTPCKITSLIRETVSLLRNDLNNSKTKIDFELNKEIPLISADKIQFQQVILNLIQNAIEAMNDLDAKERRIRIQCKQFDNNNIEITIKDSGPGFSKELIHKVFQPFFTTKAHGRGMGLAICRSIIEAHGGKFSINPNTNNHSWIRFTLPIR